jgi:hypothetical protein
MLRIHVQAERKFKIYPGFGLYIQAIEGRGSREPDHLIGVAERGGLLSVSPFWDTCKASINPYGLLFTFLQPLQKASYNKNVI